MNVGGYAAYLLECCSCSCGCCRAVLLSRPSRFFVLPKPHLVRSCLAQPRSRKDIFNHPTFFVATSWWLLGSNRRDCNWSCPVWRIQRYAQSHRFVASSSAVVHVLRYPLWVLPSATTTTITESASLLRSRLANLQSNTLSSYCCASLTAIVCMQKSSTLLQATRSGHCFGAELLGNRLTVYGIDRPSSLERGKIHHCMWGRMSFQRKDLSNGRGGLQNG